MSAAAEGAASFAAGAAANGASQLLLSPVEVVVARAVVSYDPRAAAGNASVADVARATWRAHGLRGFYAGYLAVRTSQLRDAVLRVCSAQLAL